MPEIIFRHAELAGSLVGTTEASVRAGGGVLEITVERDQWVPAMDDFLKVEVLAGLASTALEAHGWANVVRHALRPEHLEVVDWYTARLTLPACPSYDVKSAETLALHVPAAALISGRELDAAMGVRASD